MCSYIPRKSISVALHTAGRAGHVHADEERGDVVEVLDVADRALHDEEHEQQRHPLVDPPWCAIAA